MAKPYLQHLKSGKSLETTYEAVRAGFVALALEKNRRATPFVAQARALKTAARKARSPRDLLNIPDIQPALLTAAGVSDKATNHLQDSDKREAVDGLIKNFLEPAGVNFVEELVFRRIHEAFSKRKLKPHTFFIGAAIETKMATEIWKMLKRGSLDNAANLTDEDQVTSVSQWLCSL